MTATAPAGWYADPASVHEHRYWDGTQWTQFVADQGVQSEAPLAAPRPLVDVDVERGLDAERAGNLEVAETVYRRADANGDPEGAYRLGALLLSKGEADEAVAALRRAADAGHTRAPHLLSLSLQDDDPAPSATPTEAVRPGLRYDGVYEHRTDSSSRYIRFLPDGRAFGVSSAPDAAAKVARWLGPDQPNASAGTVTVDPGDGRLHFSLSSAHGSVEYHGQLDDDGSLVLDVVSHINGHQATGQPYRFAAVEGV